MVYRSPWTIWGGTLAVAIGVTACTPQSAQNTGPVVEDRAFSLRPAALTTTAPFLNIHLDNLKVTQRVEQGTGNVVDPPTLSATLKVRNTSEDHALRLIAGEVRYLDGAGKPIRLAAGREEPRFEFYSYSAERLDPGKEISRDVSLSFPAAALKDKTLREIRLQLDYIPVPYREETIELPVALEG